MYRPMTMRYTGIRAHARYFVPYTTRKQTAARKLGASGKVKGDSRIEGATLMVQMTGCNGTVRWWHCPRGPAC